MKSRIFLLVLTAVVLSSYSGIAESADRTEYYALFMEGKKVGYAEGIRTEKNDTVTNIQNISITISRGGSPITITTSQTADETKDGKPISFESVQKMSFMEMKMSGKIDANGIVDLTVNSFGAQQKKTFAWPKDAVLTEGLMLIQKKHGLKSGTNYTVKVFQPDIQQAVDANITVGDKKQVDLLGRVVSLTECKTKMNVPMAGEIESIDYVDDQLNTQKNVTPIAGMVIEMIACEKEVAMSPVESFDVLDRMFIASPQPIDRADLGKSIQYVLSPVKEPNRPSQMFKIDKKIRLDSIPSSDNQKVEIVDNNQVIVTVSPVDAPAGAKFPYKGDDEKILNMLKPTRFIQSDNEKIIALARQAVGDTNDGAVAIRRIEKFVADYMENKNLSVGYASALEAAESKQGDCSEFAVLTAALCRAAGIPARMAAGIAYVSSWMSQSNLFGGHAWVEAYVGDRWVGLDATFKSTGRGGYDAGHIALAYGNGDPEDFLNLLNTMGQFKIEKIVIEKK
jgi:hypothetical protein